MSDKESQTKEVKKYWKLWRKKLNVPKILRNSGNFLHVNFTPLFFAARSCNDDCRLPNKVFKRGNYTYYRWDLCNLISNWHAEDHIRCWLSTQAVTVNRRFKWEEYCYITVGVLDLEKATAKEIEVHQKRIDKLAEKQHAKWKKEFKEAEKRSKNRQNVVLKALIELREELL